MTIQKTKEKMTDWDRKNLDALHSALAKEISRDPSLGRHAVQLIAIKNNIVMSFGHEAATLQKCRDELCTACRGNKLYVCDQDTGWSPTCAFLKANND